MFAVLGFGTTHAALDAEALLLDTGIDVVPIPAPKELGALCGIALRLELDDEARAMRYLESAGMPPKSRLELEDI
jgi:type III secretory pathway lipoprotein EscJ